MRKQRQEKPAPWRFLGVLDDTEQLCHPSAPPPPEKRAGPGHELSTSKTPCHSGATVSYPER